MKENKDNSILLLPQQLYLNNNTEDLDGELWLPVFGQERFYSVSNLGRIAKANSNSDVRIIPQILNKSDGLPRFKINKEWYFTHEIVAIAHAIPNPHGLKEIGHVNGVKTDNRPDNLEYVEINSDNIISPYVLCDFTRIPSASASSSPIVKVNKDGSRLSAYLSVKSAADRENKTTDKIFSLLKSDHTKNVEVSWMKLREYFNTPKFKAQANYITTHQKIKHPFML